MNSEQPQKSNRRSLRGQPAPPPPPAPKIANKYRVTARGNELFLMHPTLAGQPMSVEDALNLCAWLLELGEVTVEELAEARALVKDSIA